MTGLRCVGPRSSQIAAIALGLTVSAHAFPDPEDSRPDVISLKTLSLEDLSRIDVTSPSKEPQPAMQSPVAIHVVTSDDIRRSGATTIPDVLRLVPGVEVASIDGNKWSVGIRGFGSRLSRSVLVLIDGRTVYTTFFAGTYWEVQDTVMEDIDRIEVIRGPGGTIWGPNAVNGVINIITKSAKETQGALVSSGGGNVEQGFLTFRYGGGNGKNLSYRIYGKGFTRGPNQHPDQRNFDDWRAAQTGFRIDWSSLGQTQPDRDTVTVQGDFYTEGAGESVQATSYTAPYSRTIDANAELSGGNVLARWKRVIREGNYIQLQTYYDRTNRYEPNFGENRDTFDADFLQRLKLPARQEFTWGLGARFSNGRAIQVVSGLTFNPNDRTDQLFTAFLQDEISLIPDRLVLTLGTKVLKTNFKGVSPLPGARLSWTPNDKQTVWAAFTHTLRTPSRVEEDFNLSGYINTAADGRPFFARFIANDNFASEQMNGYELGCRRLVGKGLYIDFSAFYNHYHDLLSQEITGTPFVETNPAPTHLLLPAQFRNGLLGTTKGLEIAPEWRPAAFWRLRGSYSYLHMNLTEAPRALDVGTAPIIAGSSPQHEAVVQSSFDLPKKFTLDLTYRYVSALPGQGVPAYSTGDARLAWRLGDRWEISLTGQNLLQPSHPEFGGDPGPVVGVRRSAYARVTWRQ